ncbi:MAG TPA: DUF5670 family protein [Thermoanaerobaculia bacterium]|jgi:maltodextrin utilization protein YvdJ
MALAVSSVLLLAWLVLISFRVTTMWVHSLLVVAAVSFLFYCVRRREGPGSLRPTVPGAHED